MKTKLLLTLIAVAVAAFVGACKKSDDHGHDHDHGGHDHGKKAASKQAKAPNGGKLFAVDGGHMELVVEKDRTATVRFFDKELKPVATGTRSVTAIGEATTGKVTLEFAAKADALATATPFPEGKPYPLALSLKATADAKPVNFRLKLDLGQCGECKLKEYACICGH